MKEERDLIDLKWQDIRDHEISEDLFEEALEILNSVHEPKSDVINWKEREEMAKIAEGRGSSVSQLTEAYGQKHSVNPKEQDLMNSLAGIMDVWESEDDKR